MPLAMSCACGKALPVLESLAGRKVRCPACGNICTMPRAEAVAEAEAINVLLDQTPAPGSTPRSRAPRPTASPRRDGTPSPPTRVGPRNVKINWRRRRREEKKKERVVNILALVGIAFCLIALVWFVTGYTSGLVAIVPTLMLAGGMIAATKGFIDGRDQRT